MDRTELEKNEVLDLAFENVDTQSIVIVGDRKSDIEAGKNHGIKTIGVTYGVGSEDEIIGAEPDTVIHSITELKKVIN
jgi:phosphoglycolate phosphatase